MVSKMDQNCIEIALKMHLKCSVADCRVTPSANPTYGILPLTLPSPTVGRGSCRDRPLCLSVGDTKDGERDTAVTRRLCRGCSNFPDTISGS